MHDPQFRTRFKREAETIAQLDHPAIVPVYDFGEEDGQPYLVMRYMPGGSLADRLKAGPLSLAEAARLFQRLAPALDEAHAAGIIHRDLKPGNILFDQRDEPYLADFGIAKISEASAALTGSMLIGTPAYMSPEQVQGAKTIDGRSDQYALGAILFEVLTGKQPYAATTPIGVAFKHVTEPVPRILSTNPHLPAQVQGIIERAMAKSPEARFASVGQMAAALASVANLPNTSTPPGALPAALTARAARSTSTPAQFAGAGSTAVIPPAAQTAQRTRRLWVGLGLAGVAVAAIGLVVIALGLSSFIASAQSKKTETATASPAIPTATPDLEATSTLVATFTYTPTDTLTPVMTPSETSSSTPLPTNTPTRTRIAATRTPLPPTWTLTYTPVPPTHTHKPPTHTPTPTMVPGTPTLAVTVVLPVGTRILITRLPGTILLPGNLLIPTATPVHLPGNIFLLTPISVVPVVSTP